MLPHLDALETLFRALSDRTRLRIMGLLAQGEVYVCEIHESRRPIRSSEAWWAQSAGGSITCARSAATPRARSASPSEGVALTGEEVALGHVLTACDRLVVRGNCLADPAKPPQQICPYRVVQVVALQ